LPCQKQVGGDSVIDPNGLVTWSKKKAKGTNVTVQVSTKKTGEYIITTAKGAARLVIGGHDDNRGEEQ